MLLCILEAMGSKYNVRQGAVLHYVAVLETANLKLAGIRDESSGNEDGAYIYQVSVKFSWILYSQ